MLRYLPIPHSQHSYLPQHHRLNGSDRVTYGSCRLNFPSSRFLPAAYRVILLHMGFLEMRSGMNAVDGVNRIPCDGLNRIPCFAAQRSRGQGVPMARKIRGRT